MLLKVNKILGISAFAVLCEMNNGAKRKIEILPLLINHKHLKSIEKLKIKSVFNQVSIGLMGELYWKNIIISKSAEILNYDISPEFIYYNGVPID